MKKDIKLYEYEEYGDVYRQEILIDGRIEFSVCNLNDCPEDAIINRNLFNAYDYMDAIEYGMKLAQQGYTELNIVKD